MNQTIRECTPDDVERIVDYFHDAEPAFSELLGVDPQKLPPREEWIHALQAQLSAPFESREKWSAMRQAAVE